MVWNDFVPYWNNKEDRTSDKKPGRIRLFVLSSRKNGPRDVYAITNYDYEK